MRRVLFILHSLHFGGAERSLVNLLNEIPKERYSVDVLLFRREGGMIEQLPEWVHLIKTPDCLAGLYSRVMHSGKQLVPKVWGTACSRILRKGRKAQAAWRWKHVYCSRIEPLEGRYDTAVAFSGAEILYYLADKVEADKKAAFIHNDYLTAGYSKEDDAPYMKKMDVIASVSNQCVDVLKTVFPDLAPKMVCIENITSSMYVRNRALAYVPNEFGEAQVKLLSIGRLWIQKGFDMAIDAAALLKRQGVDFRWLIIGEGKLRSELQKQIDRQGLSDRVFLIGVRDNPYPYMKICDILVQSSRYEGKSVVLDEAKILCKPLVVTDYPTVCDQVIHGREGIVTGMSAEGIAEGILELLTDTEKRDAVVSYLTDTEYGNQAEVAKYIKLLDE